MSTVRSRPRLATLDEAGREGQLLATAIDPRGRTLVHRVPGHGHAPQRDPSQAQVVTTPARQ